MRWVKMPQEISTSYFEMLFFSIQMNGTILKNYQELSQLLRMQTELY